MNQINRSVNKISYVAFALLLFLPLGCGPSSGTDDFALAYDFVRNNLDDDNWEYLNSDSSLKARLNADIRLAISTSDSRLKDGSLPGEIFANTCWRQVSTPSSLMTGVASACLLFRICAAIS